MLRIRKGFQGQRLTVYPFYTVGNRQRPALRVQSMGAFPRAAHHYVERPEGCGEYILIWCTDGEGWYSLHGEKHTVSKSHFFMLPPDGAHAYGSSEDNPWSIYWFHFTGEDAPSAYERGRGVQTFPMEGRIRDVSTLFDELLSLMEGHADEETAAFIDFSFPRLLSAFLYPDIWQRNGSANGSPNVSIVGKAAHFMEEHLSEKLSLADICSYLGYSESYVTRIFSAEAGCGPMTYLQRLKVARACRLLANTDLKINQIAFMVGFDDPLYFSKFFAKAKGVSPKEYRKARHA
ncbi:MAG: AraC family transcriptional regulator [Bacteroidales bacterium]|nr:AraC family transcriptional regulator [Bacteroidales bacterium]